MSWRLARSLDQLRDEVQRRWPGTTVWTIGDADHAARASDHNPNQDGVVCAIDVVGARQADAVWQHLLADPDPRVKYLIYRGRIVSSTHLPWKVRPYHGPNPHTDHIHISVGRGPDGQSDDPWRYDDPAPWGLHDQEDDMTEDDRLLLKDIAARVERIERRIGTRHEDRSEVLNDLGRLRRTVRMLAAHAGLPTDYAPPEVADV